jgi:hypothetical protein
MGEKERAEGRVSDDLVQVRSILNQNQGGGLNKRESKSMKTSVLGPSF